MPVSDQIVTRDKTNGYSARDRALVKLRTAHPHLFNDDITGAYNEANKAIASQFNADQKSWIQIKEHPFHAMVHVNTELRNGKSRNNVIWYTHEGISAPQILGDVVILPWTHPGIQVALTEDFDDSYEIDDSRYNLAEVTPLSRARFQEVIPDVVGIYDPGGRVGVAKDIQRQTGLKAVKLQMTKDQVKAFISKMQGVLYVTGAPGSGKTTVALQRMRFLFDKGEERAEVEHTPDTSRVFLANQNLIDHTTILLEKQLEIPSSVLMLVSNFVENYLDDAWKYKHDALFLSHPIKNHLVRRGREAFFSTCSVDDLKSCWKTYDIQIVQRLLEVNQAEWNQLFPKNSKFSSEAEKLTSKILEFAEHQQSRRPVNDPFSSEVRMDKLYASCARQYDSLRSVLSRQEVERFDGVFLKWLFYVYDPLDGVATYFKSKIHEGSLRIQRGTASRVSEENVIDQIFDDFAERQYRQEELTWFAWLLRFALPSATDPKNRFREVPIAESPIANKYGPWSHVVIDEAQDLSVVEASLIASFVVRNGALTISADFKQVVSPVHGMEDPSAFKVGCHLISRADDFKQFPFTKNMRQSGQIGNFLRGFYAKAFGELPKFFANEELNGPKPQLRLMPYTNYATTIKSALNTFKRANFNGSIAVIQINEDEDEMVSYRDMLTKAQIKLAPIWASDGSEGELVTTSVERIKGLEYDICFVLGFEQAENASINFNKNRVYVALSRPTQRLFMLCEHFPGLLHGVNSDLYDVIDDR